MVSLSTLVFTALQMKEKSDTNYVAELEKRVDGLEKRIVLCEAARAALAQENFDLMRHLLMPVKGPVQP